MYYTVGTVHLIRKVIVVLELGIQGEKNVKRLCQIVVDLRREKMF